MIVAKGKIGQEFVEKYFQNNQNTLNVAGIFVYTSKNSFQRNKEWAKNYTIVKKVTFGIKELI